MKDDKYDVMIRKAGWFKGTHRQWDAMDRDAQKDAAFKGCGCAIAYPTWVGPVDCSHAECQIRRGEIQPIVETNRILKQEMWRGWLRFDKSSDEGRRRLARLIRAIRRTAMETGVYDPWEMDGAWQAIVGSSLSS